MCVSHGAHKRKRKKRRKCEANILWVGSPGDKDPNPVVGGYQAWEWGKLCMRGDSVCTHGGKRGDVTKSVKSIVESLVVVGRYLMAFHDRGEEGTERDLKACVIIAQSQSGNWLVVDVRTLCEDEDFVVVDHGVGVAFRRGASRCRGR